MRHRILEEAAAADVNLVQTYRLGPGGAGGRSGGRGVTSQIFLDAGVRCGSVELYADLDTRLARNRTAYRLVGEEVEARPRLVRRQRPLTGAVTSSTPDPVIR